MTARVRHFFTATYATYGYRRIHADLVEEGTECSPELVRQIMRAEGLVACQPRPFRVTTDADDAAAANMPDLVERDFTAERAGVKFVGDITYIHTWQGFVYLATVIDCYSKKVVGWSIADHMRTELVETALKNAAATTVIEPRAIFHSDRGSVGGFNRLSQHPVSREVCDGTSSAGGRSGSSTVDALSGASEISATRRSGVLGPDRRRALS